MLNSIIQEEITRLSLEIGVKPSTLENFAEFVLKSQKAKTTKPSSKVSKPKKVKPLSLAEVKTAVFNYFDVKDLKSLRSSTDFQVAVSENKSLNFQKKEAWEDLYRQFVGILPHEVNEVGKDCINGINIFKYFRPWQVFNLDPKNASEEDIKSAYRELSKKYHPDNSQTGDAKIFDRINTMYKSILPKTFGG
ncbi:MAG: DnaJ domain-containing protein [Snowella sp.]|nr:DnaJ domain-containing protein [Snowella sp.]